MDAALHKKLYDLYYNSFSEDIDVTVTQEEFDKLVNHATYMDDKHESEEQIDRESHFAKKTTPFHGFIHKRLLPTLMEDNVFLYLGVRFKITVV